MSKVNIIGDKADRDSRVKVAMVLSHFNSAVVEGLYDGALKSLMQHGVSKADITVVKVPGAFEIAIAVKALLDKNEYDAVITLGAIIRGETTHFEYISSACTHSIAQLGMERGIPVTFGVLTVDNVQQAMARAGDGKNNKGFEAASAALEMIGVLRKLDRERTDCVSDQ